MKPEIVRMAERIREAGGYRWVGIYAVGRHEISVIGWSGQAAPAHPRFPKEHGLCGAAAASGTTVRVDDVTKDPRYLDTFSSTRSEIVVPVKRPTGEVVGLIDVESEKPNAFGSEDERRLEKFALQAADIWK